MSAEHDPSKRLKAIIDAAEALVLNATDAELLRAEPAAERVRDRVLALSGRQRPVPTEAPGTTFADTGAPSPHGSRRPRSSAERPGALTAFLRQLAATRPGLSPRLQATFGVGRSPSTEEVEALAVDLLKRRIGAPRKKR